MHSPPPTGEALEQAALYDTAFHLQLGYSNHIRIQKRMLGSIRRMREQVETVLGD